MLHKYIYIIKKKTSPSKLVEKLSVVLMIQQIIEFFKEKLKNKNFILIFI